MNTNLGFSQIYASLTMHIWSRYDAFMGRPPRTTDEDLTIQIQSLVAREGSMRKVALSLGIEPSTLSRSVAKGAFSRTTKKRILENWGNASHSFSSQKMQHSDVKDRQNLLHLMTILNSILSTAVAELEAPLGKVDSPEVQSTRLQRQ